MRNYSLFTAIIFLMNFSSVIGQTLCDGSLIDSTSHIFSVVETMPKPNLLKKQLEPILNSSINLAKYGLAEGTKIYLGFIVNCKGEDFDYKVLRPVNDAFEEKLISVIQSNLEFKNGSQRGHAVDVALTYQIVVKNGSLNILDEQEIQNNNQNKRKRRKKK
jgi:hypothetical protein